MKIVIIGPVPPYRGGISHYTALMSKALAVKHEVINLSYSMQYPKFLYKGGEQKERGDDRLTVEAEFCLNTANPMSWLKTAKRINKLKPDLLIVQWWHPYFAPCYWTIHKFLNESIKEMFLCHNVFPHVRFPISKQLSEMVLKHGGNFIVQSEQDKQDLLTVKPDAKVICTPHPTYEFFNRGTYIADRRGDEINLLFFGFVREYKGLRYLLEAFPLIHCDCRLQIVGEVAEGEKARYCELISKADPTGEHICLIDKYVPDNEVEHYFKACDLVILPYLSATQSGIVQIAYGFEKPVVATAVGGLTEVVVDGETGFLIPSQDSQAIAKAVDGFASEPDKARFSAAIRKEAYKYSWSRLVEVVEELAGVNNK